MSPIGAGRLPAIGRLPGVGSTAPIQNPGWHTALGNRALGGFPGGGLGWAGGVPGSSAFWAYSHPYPWYTGHWHNHWYGNGFGGYWGRNYPLAWGLAGWGLGNLWYSSGYLPYSNPYYASGMVGAYNYARPVPAPSIPPLVGPNAVGPNAAGGSLANAGNADVDLAVAKFRSGDYAGALELVDGVIRVQPSDAAAHELRALILFALDDYPRAAATLHSLLAIGPGWNWTTLSSLYPDMEVYQSQLKSLESYVLLHPQQADARFLLAYHYITQGHTAAAKEQLRAVVSLLPDDRLAAHLLSMVGGSGNPPPPAANPPPANPPAANGRPVDLATLTGDWHARRGDGATFDLTLSPDKTFTWKFTQQDHRENISGTVTMSNSILILQGKTNGAMVAQLSDVGPNQFTFKALGGPSDDAGLTFRR